MARVIAGRYELDALLGQGASGEVWRAKDITTHRVVAVKIIELAAVDDPIWIAETVARFRREAAILARLRHPNVVSATDAGRAGNDLFIVMEMADGVPLSRRLEQRAANNWGLFPVRDALRIAGQACAGLAAAHAQGVVHRDVKPGNLMVSARLDVKVIDFGIARLLADNERITHPSTVLGTVAYMSPEQAEGRADVDARSDLYSLGCVLYELLSGRLPFLADDSHMVMLMQVSAHAEPLGAIRPDLPAGLSELVGALLMKDPAARPPDAGHVAGWTEAISARMTSRDERWEADRETFREPDAAGRPEAARRTPHAPAGPVQQPPVRPVLQAPPARVPAPREPAPPQHDMLPWQPAPPQPPQPQPRQPQWPAPPPEYRPRRRSRWRGALSSLVTIAIVGGVGYYVWHRTHDILKVTSVSVTLAQPPGHRCNITVDVTATIMTNGNGGLVTYQWTRDSSPAEPEATVSVASGQPTAQVHLTWTFRGKGPHHAIAHLQVLAPDPATGNIAFTYSCPG